DSSGVNASMVTFKTPSGFKKDVWLNYNNSSGLWEGTYEVKSTDEPGTWTSTYMFLKDNVGNYGSIDPSLRITVINNTSEVDNQIPKVESININPTEASVGDIITIKAKITDSSGVNASMVTFKTPSGFKKDVWLNYNNSSGLWEGTYEVKSTDEPGTWASTYMFLKDNVGNYGSINPSLNFTIILDNVAPEKPSVYELTDQSTSVTGTAEIGSTIIVKVGTMVLGTAITQTEGKYLITIPKQKAGIILTVTATDQSGNVSEAREVTVKDVTAPSIPVVNEITESSTSVTGTAEVGSLITVKAGTMELGTAMTTDEGNYSVTIAKQKAGIILTVIATDNVGNVSNAKEVTVKDITPPSIPTVDEVTDKSTSVTGTTESGSVVTVKVGASIIGTSIAGLDGKYAVLIAKQKAGTKLTVTAIDEAGNISEAKEVTVKDVTAPSIPMVNEVTDKSTSVVGTAEVDSRITVKAGTTVLGTATSTAEGKYAVTIPKQKAGTKLTVTSTDEAGNVSEAKEVTVKDVTAPSIPMVNEVTDKSTSVIGTAEVDSRITVKAGTTVLGTATTTAEGKYAVTIPKQKAGTKLTVTSTDEAGNVSEAKEVTVKDVTAPSIPTVNAVNNKTTTVTGKTEKYAMVTVKIGTKTYKVKADVYGNYKVTIPVQNTGISISIIATDSVGNVSVARTTKVVRVAPNIPTVNVVNNKSTSVTGKTEKYAMVTVKIGTKSYKAKADGYGNYKVIIPVQNTGISILTTATDSKGNVSVARTTKVVRVAPNMPTVKSVNNKSTSVTGKTEKYAMVTVKIGTKTYIAKADVYGNFKVSIPKQRAGTKIFVYAKDSKGFVSATRTVTISN
ncbi:Ig-like domain-containing protein, partial [Gottfriedia acidiceleris]|uniref:Ig-like domain-containing protein n=1 Tax=Gottfriedia acidiceleris TaxID=371036 RepID=UPI003399C46E